MGVMGVYTGVTGSHWVSIWESLGVYMGVTRCLCGSHWESLGVYRGVTWSLSVSIWESLGVYMGVTQLFLFLSITMKNQMDNISCVSYLPNIVH